MTAVAVALAASAGWLSLGPGPTPPPGTAPARRWRLLAAALSVGGVLAAGPLLALAIPVVVAVRGLLRGRARRRNARATAARVLETCELLAAEVSSGQPPEWSLARAADAWPLLAPVARAAHLGGDVPQALRELAARPGAGELRLVAAAWAVAHRTGSGLADALARVAVMIRADRATQQVVEGELASARATARLIAALPLLVLLLGSGAGAGPWRFLLDTPLGLLCLAGGLGTGLLGLWWIERIADGVHR